MRAVDEFNGEDLLCLAVLHSSERELLKVIYAVYAGQLFNDTQFMKLRMLGRSGVEHHLLLAGLRRKGKIRAVMKSWGERLYYIPMEQLPRLHNEFYGYIPQEVKEECRIVKEAKPGLVYDLFQMLVFIAQGRLLLSAKGLIHKKSIQKIEERVHLRTEDLKQLSLQLPNAENAPLHIAFLLDVLDCLKLVCRESKSIVVQEKALSHWLKMSTDQITNVLVRIVSERFGSYDSDMEHLYCQMSQPALLSGRWVDIELLVDGLVVQQLLDRSRAYQMTERAIAWVSACAGLGWMDMGVFTGHRSCFRWRIPSDPCLTTEMESVLTNPFYVQPEFDIIVLPEIPNLLRFKLSMFTSLLISDRISIYKLTENSVTQAIRRGIGVSDILSFLSIHCEGEFPAHVLLTLQKWNAEMMLNESGSNVSLGESNCWNLPTEDEPEQESRSIDEYHLILEDLPTIQSLFPDLAQIPLRWRRDLRRYHYSTARQMIEQSILWNTKVKLTLHGNEVDFIPLNMSNNSDRIVGEIFNPIIQQYERIELSCNDWDEMRMVIPEFT